MLFEDERRAADRYASFCQGERLIDAVHMAGDPYLVSAVLATVSNALRLLCDRRQHVIRLATGDYCVPGREDGSSICDDPVQALLAWYHGQQLIGLRSAMRLMDTESRSATDRSSQHEPADDTSDNANG